MIAHFSMFITSAAQRCSDKLNNACCIRSQFFHNPWLSGSLLHDSRCCPSVHTCCCCHCRASRCTPLLILSRLELTTQLSLHRPRHRMQLASCTPVAPQVISSTPALLSHSHCNAVHPSSADMASEKPSESARFCPAKISCGLAHSLVSRQAHLLPLLLGLISCGEVMKTPSLD